MADTKFTPGPYHAGNLRINGANPKVDGCDIGAENGANIAIALHQATDREPAETRANARLIAAAPDLYVALKEMFEEAAAYEEDGTRFDRERNDRARAALAKVQP